VQRPDRGLIADSVVGFAFGGLLAEVVDVGGLAWLGEQAGWGARVEFDGVTFSAAPATALEWGGGLGALMVASILLVLIYAGRGPYRTARLAVLWSMLHLLARGFVQVAAVPLDDQSAAAKALDAVGWGDFGVTLAAITAVVALVGMGTLAGAEFAQFSRTEFAGPGEARAFVAWMTAPGVLLGLPLAILFLWPLQDTSVILDGMATAFVAVMSIAMAGWYVNVVPKGVPRRVVNFGLIVMTVALAFGIRIYAYQL